MQPYRKQKQTFAEDTVASIIIILAAAVVLTWAAFNTWYPDIETDPATQKIVEIIDACEHHGSFDTGTVRIECKVIVE